MLLWMLVDAIFEPNMADDYNNFLTPSNLYKREYLFFDVIYMYHCSVISYKNIKSVNQGVYFYYLNLKHRHHWRIVVKA